MSACNCSGCPHAANCRCVCVECAAFQAEFARATAYYRRLYGWDGNEPPRLDLGGIGETDEEADEAQIVHTPK